MHGQKRAGCALYFLIEKGDVVQTPGSPRLFSLSRQVSFAVNAAEGTCRSKYFFLRRSRCNGNRNGAHFF